MSSQPHTVNGDTPESPPPSYYADHVRMANRARNDKKGGLPMPEVEYKLVLIGNSSVGKSSLLKRFKTGQPPINIAATAGSAFETCIVEKSGKSVRLNIFDTAGMERFRTLTRAHYGGAQGVLLVYDISDEESFEALPGWLDELRSRNSDNIPTIIVGNKLDMDHVRVVSSFRGATFAERNGALFGEASAKEDVGVRQVFERLVQSIMENPQAQDPAPRELGYPIVQMGPPSAEQNGPRKGCCSS